MVKALAIPRSLTRKGFGDRSATGSTILNSTRRVACRAKNWHWHRSCARGKIVGGWHPRRYAETADLCQALVLSAGSSIARMDSGLAPVDRQGHRMVEPTFSPSAQLSPHVRHKVMIVADASFRRS